MSLISNRARAWLQIVLLLPFLLLAGCQPEAPPPPPVPQEMTPTDLASRIRALDGVESLETGADVWTVTLGTALEEARYDAIATEIEKLAGQTTFDHTPRMIATSGVISGELKVSGTSTEHTPGLGWIAVLRDQPGVVTAQITGEDVKLTLTDPTDLLAWTAGLLGQHPDALQRGELDADVEGGRGRLSLSDYCQDCGALAERLGGLLAGHRVTVFGSTELTVELGDHEPAAEVARKLADTLPAQYAVRLSSSSMGCRAKVQELPTQVAECEKVAQALAPAGGRAVLEVDPTSLLRVEVPDVDAAERALDQLSAMTWPGMIAIDVKGLGWQVHHQFQADISWWTTIRGLWSDALRAGLRPVISRPTPRHDTDVVMVFHDDAGGIPLHTEEGSKAVVQVLRSHPWEGTVTITLGGETDLSFTSTATGEATEIKVDGDQSGKPDAWQADFLQRWNASATN